MYKIIFSEECAKQISKLDNSTYILLKNWMLKHLYNTDNPRSIGKALSSNKKGLWRYRIGNYRLIVQIKDYELTVLALEFGHRSTICK